MSFSIALFAAGVACLLIFLNKRRRYRFPPGPRGLPILGNIFDAPKEHEWRTFQEWGRKYDSDVVHFEILGTHYVVLNSAKATFDLFERRSNLYSDRPQAAMLELTGWDRNWGLMKYGDFWRAHRKVFHQYFRSNATHAFHPRLTKVVRQLLRSLYVTPEHFLEHIRFMTASNIISIMYGIDVKSEGDPLLSIVEEATDTLIKVGHPGVYLVDSFPLRLKFKVYSLGSSATFIGISVKYVPSWFPGATFKRDAESWKPTVDRMYMQPYNDVKTAYDNGNAIPCLATDMLAELYKNEAEPWRATLEEVIISVTGTGYLSATDTTASALSTFVLAMMLYPEAQHAAQEELDHVIGRDRLPEMEDEQLLPYITALMQETMRWRPVLFLGVAHRLVVDDEYGGYDIPAGSVMIGNIRAILHDEVLFPDPEDFDPSRFLDSEGHLLKRLGDFVSNAFGFGRRICPGRYFAKDVMWLTIASLLAAFTIEKPTDESGKAVEPSGEYTSGLTSHPVPFKAVFKPRSSIALTQ